MRELPQLDSRLCTGCGDCIAICPTACLVLGGRLPLLVRPRDCVSCSACVVICPVSALRLVEPFQDLLEAGEGADVAFAGGGGLNS